MGTLAAMRTRWPGWAITIAVAAAIVSIAVSITVIVITLTRSHGDPAACKAAVRQRAAYIMAHPSTKPDISMPGPCQGLDEATQRRIVRELIREGM